MKLFFCFLMISALSGAAGARDYELPSSYDLRDINGRSYVGEVRDQGHCGSCYAFAVMAAAESTWNLSHNLYNGQAIDMSEAFMVWSLSPLYDDMEVCNGGSTMGPMNSLLDY
ncbi:MAG: C1 family peptidase, partial [Syntrophomonadaceae bacterium]|nr:C1 family peptidase [Syntrophomonadaceae bacterium]